MENKSFLNEFKAYFIIGFAFIVLTIWYFFWATIADIGYVYSFILQILQGNFNGQIVPFESLTHYKQMEVGLFGPDYWAIAPEFIRAFEERQELLPIVFLVEAILFLTMFIIAKGRKKANITNPEDTVLVYSAFQRFIVFGNILFMMYLFITGFSITFGNLTGGGFIARWMRMTHELVGVAWIPIWLAITVIAFKDHKLFMRPSSKLYKKIFLKGKYSHMNRINYYAFVAFSGLLVLSGFILWFMHPDFHTHVEEIQLKRLLIFVHFMGSAIISFFTFEIVYSYFISVKGYLPGLISGRLPREYVEQLRPDIIDELEEKK